MLRRAERDTRNRHDHSDLDGAAVGSCAGDWYYNAGTGQHQLQDVRPQDVKADGIAPPVG